MSRFPNWAHLLDRFLLDSQAKQFRYGSFDCGLFCADAILAMSGTDLAVGLRGQYRSRLQAMDKMRLCSGATSIIAFVEHIATEHALQEIRPAHAGRGDLVVFKQKVCSLGIVALNGREIVAPATVGLARIPLSRADRAWRI